MPLASPLLILFLAALCAGCQNALAGGGTFLTLPALMLTGMDARAANITSTVALFPSQVTTGMQGWGQATGAAGLSLRMLILISLVGGMAGAGLLLLTPSAIFARMVPWLVLFATMMFAWGSFGRKRADGGARLGRAGAGAAQFLISVYGGYFGGGIGFLMLAALTAANVAIRPASAIKNLLSGVMNAAAVAIFLFSSELHWAQMVVVAIGAVIGGTLGILMLNRVNEKTLRICVVLLGLALTVGLFLRAS
jgi:uncharacterized membrane protein YfcA